MGADFSNRSFESSLDERSSATPPEILLGEALGLAFVKFGTQDSGDLSDFGDWGAIGESGDTGSRWCWGDYPSQRAEDQATEDWPNLPSVAERPKEEKREQRHGERPQGPRQARRSRLGVMRNDWLSWDLM